MAGRPTFGERVDVAERRRKAIEMRRGGAEWADIGRELGYGGKSEKAQAAAASTDVRRALKHLVEEPAEEMKAEEVSRLNAMLVGLWPAARRGNVAAVDRVLRIMERRARYFPLEVPRTFEGKLTGELDAEISALVAELADGNVSAGADHPG